MYSYLNYFYFDSLVTMGSMDLKETKVNLAILFLVPMDLKVQEEMQVGLVHPVATACKVKVEHLVFKAQK